MVQLADVYRVMWRERLRHITWRGEIRSCNYPCPYCPFAKRPVSDDELGRDKKAMEKLTAFLREGGFSHAVSLLIAPWGEALVHEHVVRGMAELSHIEHVAAVSCQTNLSVGANTLLRIWRESGADCDKLALWCTYHPDYADMDLFVEGVRSLSREIALCVGVVGDPEKLDVIQAIREKLPENIPFWVNAMKGLRRPYTEDERAAFLNLDPHFALELAQYKTDFGGCTAGRESIFVTGNGDVFPCNRSKIKLGNLYRGDVETAPENGHCKGRCDCFTAYSARRDLASLQVYHGRAQLRLKKSFC